MTQRQPDGQTNLAERIGLSSRYYIKNNMATEACLPDDAQAELSKESTVHLLDLNPNAVAAQLLVEDFNIFRYVFNFNVFKFEENIICGNVYRHQVVQNHPFFEPSKDIKSNKSHS